MEKKAVETLPFHYAPDNVFKAKLEMSLVGVVNALAVMLMLGHRPAVNRLEDVTRRVFKDPALKRDRHSDLRCERCNRKFEAKAKTNDKYFMVGPDLLRLYNNENSTIIFSFPSKIVAVEAEELFARRNLAIPGRNKEGEPFLNFYGLEIPSILEIRRRQSCCEVEAAVNYARVST
jgi:hypothetical protein